MSFALMKPQTDLNKQIHQEQQQQKLMKFPKNIQILSHKKRLVDGDKDQALVTFHLMQEFLKMLNHQQSLILINSGCLYSVFYVFWFIS